MTHFPVLDRLIGTPRPGSLYAVASRPGMGKTAFALNIALRWASAGRPALYVSADMHLKVLVPRLLALQAGIPVRRIKTGLLSPQELAAASAGAEALLRLPLLVLDAYRPMPWNGLFQRIAAMVESQGIGLFVLDSLQCFRSTSLHGKVSGASSMAAVAGLGALAERTGCAGLIVAGMNRAIECRRERIPRLGDLRGGESLAGRFQGVFFLDRPDARDVGLRDPDHGLPERLDICCIAPSRRNERIEARLWMDSESMRIEER